MSFFLSNSDYFPGKMHWSNLFFVTCIKTLRSTPEFPVNFTLLCICHYNGFNIYWVRFYPWMIKRTLVRCFWPMDVDLREEKCASNWTGSLWLGYPCSLLSHTPCLRVPRSTESFSPTYMRGHALCPRTLHWKQSS